MKNKEVLIGLIISITLLTLPVLFGFYYSPPIAQQVIYVQEDNCDLYVIYDVHLWSANWSVEMNSSDNITNDRFLFYDDFTDVLNESQTWKEYSIEGEWGFSRYDLDGNAIYEWVETNEK